MASDFPDTGNLVLNIIIVLVAGGAVTTWLTFIFDNLSKKRAEHIDISKQKIDAISKSKPKFYQLANYYIEIARLLDFKVEDRNWNRILYVGCKIILIRNCIFEEYGAIQLNNLLAETIIDSFGLEFVKKISDDFDKSRMQNIAEAYPSYSMLVKYLDKITEDKDDVKGLYDKLKNVLSAEDSKQLRKFCSWYGQLLNFELNQIYSRWYEDKPQIRSLDQDLQDYLEDNYYDYYKRLTSLTSP